MAKLDLHKCRRTYGQMILDEGVPTDMVSVLYGHASTATMEKSSCRQKQQKASLSARNIWDHQAPNLTLDIRPDTKNPKIDKNKWDTGYIN